MSDYRGDRLPTAPRILGLGRRAAEEVPSARMTGERGARPLAGLGVLVTGASSGIGRAVALGAARAGADVALTYRANERGAREVAADIEALDRRAAVLQL